MWVELVGGGGYGLPSSNSDVEQWWPISLSAPTGAQGASWSDAAEASMSYCLSDDSAKSDSQFSY